MSRIKRSLCSGRLYTESERESPRGRIESSGKAADFITMSTPTESKREADVRRRDDDDDGVDLQRAARNFLAQLDRKRLLSRGIRKA